MRRIKIAGIEISDDSLPFVIAEVGHNHQGKLEQALELIRAAASAGASAVKFQKRDNKSMFTPAMYNEPYNSENSFGNSYGLHRDALEFGADEYKSCITEAQKQKIIFFATAFDFKSADFLESLDMPLYKIASGDLTNLPLLEYVAGFGKPMIISTGGANFAMIDNAVRTIQKFHNNFAILQCTASYPADFKQLNLRVIEKLREKYPENVIGFSGHDNGIAMSTAAFTLGARIIEKHFTLNRALKGTDHAFSLEPQGLGKLVRDLRRTSEALGDGNKVVYENELAPMRKMRKMRKMIVANRFLPAGTQIARGDLEFRSPGDGLGPDKLDLILGKTLVVDVNEYEPILTSSIRQE
jgi:N-acetylneuraminate synthase/sialic acid synthase